MPSTEPAAAERAAVERPVLFSGPMVRAILEGRKTQTRRVMEPQPRSGQTWGVVEESERYAGEWFQWYDGGEKTASFSCPYGVIGDRLWVREAFTVQPQSAISSRDLVFYRADVGNTYLDGKWKPSIFMPRWASRILLEIVEVRVQRVHEISDADARAEGALPMNISGTLNGEPMTGVVIDPRKAYQLLWDSINEKRGYGWRGNPWVWAITFKRVAPEQK